MSHFLEAQFLRDAKAKYAIEGDYAIIPLSSFSDDKMAKRLEAKGFGRFFDMRKRDGQRRKSYINELRVNKDMFMSVMSNHRSAFARLKEADEKNNRAIQGENPMTPNNTRRNNRIVVMLDNGLTYGEIAEQLGLTRSTVAGVAHRNKREYRDRLLRGKEERRAKRDQQINRTKKSIEAAYARMRGRARKSDVIRALLAEGGHRLCHISRELDCSKQLITQIAKKMG